MKVLKYSTQYGDMGYYKLGESKRIIVFLHGFLGKPMFLEELYERFGPKGYAILAPVFPGHGKSFPLPKDFSFDELHSVVKDFLKATEAHEINLIGHSLGGAAAFRLGQNNDLPIKNVVMLAPGLGKFEARNSKYIGKFFQDLKFDYPKTWFVSYFIRAILEEGQWQQIIFPKRMAKLVRSTNVIVKDFPKRVKALALWGRDDLIVPAKLYFEELKKVSNMEVKFMEGGHHFYVVRKEEYFKYLEEFLK